MNTFEHGPSGKETHLHGMEMGLELKRRLFIEKLGERVKVREREPSAGVWLEFVKGTTKQVVGLSERLLFCTPKSKQLSLAFIHCG
jgi:hypothetical protein